MPPRLHQQPQGIDLPPGDHHDGYAQQGGSAREKGNGTTPPTGEPLPRTGDDEGHGGREKRAVAPPSGFGTGAVGHDRQGSRIPHLATRHAGPSRGSVFRPWPPRL